jgi:serine/threonine-protein kinase
VEKLADRFILECEVGSGGMSTVHLGRDEVLGRPVAVKVLKSGFADTDIGDRFQREGKTAASLSHPSIVPVYDAGEGEIGGREVSYIVMEHVSGGDLKDLLDKRGPLGKKELSRIGREVAEGLAHAHSRGIVHRDIKPHNILLDEAGRPKLTDFGIARALESTRFTQTGSYLGTALYSSPEQLRGRDITVKSDIYSLGATLYQAAAGAAPFQGSAMVVAEKHLSEEPRPPSELNPGVDERLEALILSCLAKDPEERPSAKEVASRLDDISGTGPSAKPAAGAVAGAAAPSRPAGSRGGSRPDGANRGESPAKKRGGRGIVAALAVVAVLALVGLMAAPSLLGGGGTEESASQGSAPQEEAAPREEAPQQNGAAPSGTSGEDAEGQPEGESGTEAPVESEPVESEPAAPDADESEADRSAPVEEAPEGSDSPDSSDSGGLSEGAAAGAVEGFYTTAAEGDYDRSSEFLSADYQSTFPNEATFEGTFATLESISFVEEPEVEISGSTATVTGTTEAVHTDRTELNTATWTVVDEGGEWKLDNIAIQDTQVV